MGAGGLAGRTSSVAMQIAGGTIPLGALLAGFLLQALSPAAALAAAAAGMAATAVTATAITPIRDAGRNNPGGTDAADPAPAAG